MEFIVNMFTFIFMISKRAVKQHIVYILTKIHGVNTVTYRNGVLNGFKKILKTQI